MRTGRWAGVAPAAALIMLTAGVAARPAGHSGASPARPVPVRHVIEIMLENHTTDDLFPGDASAARGRRVRAPRNEGDVQGGIHNNRADELAAMDERPGRGYLMDRYTHPPFGVSAITTFGSWADPNLRYLARSYEFGARNFQPVIGPTRPNIMMAVNGTAHGWYYNRPNPHPSPWYSIFDELAAHGHSWRIYLALPQQFLRGTVWYSLVPPQEAAGITTAGHFFADLATGHLPAFSFIRPGWGYSEEPREDIGEGDAWLGQLINAVAHSRYWRSTALFITYDEGGGFADHIAPPVPSGYGTRTPMLIVSPWARRGVFGRDTTNVSVLSYLQHLWRMPALTSLNAQQDDLAAAFSYRQRPLPRPRVPVAPRDTIGFHGPHLPDHVRLAHPHGPLRLYLDAQNGGLAVDRGVAGRVRLTVTAPRGVKVHAFPMTTRFVAGRAMVKVTFPVPGYYRIEASGPHGSLGWVTVVVPGRAHRAAPGTAGLPRSGL
jgi:phospholipase C